MKTQRRTFSKTFKTKAVEYWNRSNKTANEVALDFSIPNGKYLSRWKGELNQEIQIDTIVENPFIDKEAEITALKNQLREVQIELNAVKSVLSFFSQ